MVVGTPPHRGATARDVITARLLGPPDLREVRKLMPALAPVLGQALAAAPAERQPDMAAFAAALQELLDAANARARTALRPAVLVGIAVGVAALALGWSAFRARAERERAELLTRIEQLNDSADVTGAVLLAKRLGEPSDSADVLLWRRLARRVTITTDPPGARASWRALTGDTTWQSLGTTPTDSVWLPRSVFRLRLERAGSAPYEVNTWPSYGSALANGDTIRLPAAESLPPGRCWCRAATSPSSCPDSRASPLSTCPTISSTGSRSPTDSSRSSWTPAAMPTPLGGRRSNATDGRCRGRTHGGPSSIAPDVPAPAPGNWAPTRRGSRSIRSRA